MDLGVNGPATAIAMERASLLNAYAQLPLEPVNASGAIIETRDGRRVIDFYGGHAVAALGYAHPAMCRALEKQLGGLSFQSNMVALELRARAAAKLVDFAPDSLTHAFLVNSGAEANENALRLAVSTTGRQKIVAMEHGFHGRTAAAAAVTYGSEGWYGFAQKPFPVSFVPRNDVDALEQSVGPDTAAVIIEPIQGVAGAFDFDPAFMRAIRAVCAANGALLIADEVQTGMGRTGYPFGMDSYGVAPDLLTTAKSLGGGFPCAAVLSNAAIAATVKPGDLGSTFGGAPLACAAIEAVIDTIHEEGLLERVQRLSRRLRESCIGGPIESIQGAGFMLGLRTPGPARELAAALLERDLLVGTSADPHVIRLLPPLVLEEEHIDTLSRALKEIRV